MKNKFFVLAGLTIAVAAIAALLNTERGKKWKNDVADNLSDWKVRWNKSTDGMEKKVKTVRNA